MRKKYYWLKLEKDFFSRLHIKLLHREPDGSELVIIYQKLLLHVINDGGNLKYGVRGDLASLAALDIDEDEAKVSALLKFLEEHGLVLITEDSCFFPEAEGAVGAETDSAARMRRFRAKKPSLEDAGDAHGEAAPAEEAGREAAPEGGAAGDAETALRDAGCSSERDAGVTPGGAKRSAGCDARERERDRARERGRACGAAPAAEPAEVLAEGPDADLFSFYESRLGPLTPYAAARLRELRDRLGEQGESLVRYGIKEAAANNASSFAYVRACAEGKAARLKEPRGKGGNDVTAAARKVEEELRREGLL